MIQTSKKALLQIYDRFIKLKGAPREIALGFALGLFVGMTPFLGLHIVIGVILASLLGFSKIAAAIGVNITNVVTAPLIYPITYWVGARLFGFARHVQWPSALSLSQFVHLLKQSPVILLDLCVGGFILGIPLAIIGYYLALNAITLYRKRVHIPPHRKSKKRENRPEA